jgi:hypothetical protein
MEGYMPDKYTRHGKRLKETVLAFSENQKDFNIARLEWKVIKYIEYDKNEHSSGESYQCICGKEDIIYLSEIYNVHNGNHLEPIGSVCIKKYFSKELYQQLKVLRRKYIKDKKERLLEIERRKYLEKQILSYGQELFTYKYGTFTIHKMSQNIGFMDFVLNTRTPNKTDLQKEIQYEKLVKYYYFTKAHEILT